MHIEDHESNCTADAGDEDNYEVVYSPCMKCGGTRVQAEEERLYGSVCLKCGLRNNGEYMPLAELNSVRELNRVKKE